ncbi:MAG: aldehyde dehydrogenase family protein [Chloroflexi bacterium]|nr:aldehyde dehydrogenase family protein [Chloroflexota bacterium]
MAAPGEELHREYEAALERAKGRLEQTYPMYVGDQPVMVGETFEHRSPIDTTMLLGCFQQGSTADARRAVAAAKEAYPAWSHRSWQERVAVLRRAAALISERVYLLAAWVSLEVGKNRLEAIGDVQETADLIDYYCDVMEEHNGFEVEMRGSPTERNRSLLRPYGPWVVISPFNFPAALLGGPAGAALLAGNTVVLKPSSDTPLVAVKLAEIFQEAGCDGGAVNLVTGPGSTLGRAFVEDTDVAGMTFTGSYDVGIGLYRSFSQRYARPIVTELGGKNPTIVTATADLDKAAEGVMRSAFGLSGQKCSACSRVYVEQSVKDDFARRLVEKTGALSMGDPTQRGVFMGPVIREDAVHKFERAVEDARWAGRVVTGGSVLRSNGLERGYFVEPTVILDLPDGHRLLREELFLPIVAVVGVDNLDAALGAANSTDYGLTAGLFSESQEEIDRFLDGVEAGVVYVNRRAGSTTGAWPGAQPFGGWKASGSSGRGAGGPYYLQQFMREQSQTIIGG